MKDEKVRLCPEFSTVTVEGSLMVCLDERLDNEDKRRRIEELRRLPGYRVIKETDEAVFLKPVWWNPPKRGRKRIALSVSLFFINYNLFFNDFMTEDHKVSSVFIYTYKNLNYFSKNIEIFDKI